MALIEERRVDEDVNIVCAAVSYLREKGITRAQLEAVNGVTYAPGTRFGTALQAAIDRGRVYLDGDRYKLALPPRRKPTLIRTDAERIVAEVIADHTDGGSPATTARLQSLRLQLQMFVSDVISAALDSYKIVDDGDGNLLFGHLRCGATQWGDGALPPSHCRRCGQPANDWTLMYARSTVTIRRDRTPALPGEPALVAALRGAFSDKELATLDRAGSDARQRLDAAIADAAADL